MSFSQLNLLPGVRHIWAGSAGVCCKCGPDKLHCSCHGKYSPMENLDTTSYKRHCSEAHLPLTNFLYHKARGTNFSEKCKTKIVLGFMSPGIKLSVRPKSPEGSSQIYEVITVHLMSLSATRGSYTGRLRELSISRKSSIFHSMMGRML